MGDAPLWLSLTVGLTVTLSLLAVAASVVVDFRLYGRGGNTRVTRRSAVATGTMFLFFCLYYIVLRLQWGVWYPAHRAARLWMIALGLLLVAGGAAVNIWGRLELGRNWANHIKIYENHTLITSGPFRYVRHPLYSSLFMMFYGGCLIYANWLGAVLTSAVFVPMMNYRAAQEEALLRQAFPAYREYQKKAGRFLPKSRSGAKGGGKS